MLINALPNKMHDQISLTDGKQRWGQVFQTANN